MHAVSKKVCLEEKTLSSNHKTIGFFIDRFKNTPRPNWEIHHKVLPVFAVLRASTVVETSLHREARIFILFDPKP